MCYSDMSTPVNVVACVSYDYPPYSKSIHMILSSVNSLHHSHNVEHFIKEENLPLGLPYVHHVKYGLGYESWPRGQFGYFNSHDDGLGF